MYSILGVGFAFPIILVMLGIIHGIDTLLTKKKELSHYARCIMVFVSTFIATVLGMFSIYNIIILFDPKKYSWNDFGYKIDFMKVYDIDLRDLTLDNLPDSKNIQTVIV